MLFADLVDWIHSNLIDQSRSRRGLIRKMREMNLLEGSQVKFTLYIELNILLIVYYDPTLFNLLFFKSCYRYNFIIYNF